MAGLVPEFDVVVVGGGPSGYPAATQAARLGARTLLVERCGSLGGTTTVGGVSVPGLFHAWGRQVIAGIGWDTVARSAEVAGLDLPDFSRWDLPHHLLQVRVSPGIYAACIDETLLAAGVEPLLHTLLAEATFTGDGWDLVLCGTEGLHRVRAGVLVDTTGDASAVGLAGLHRLRSAERQPGTIMVHLSGYDLDTADLDGLRAAHAAAVADGRVLPTDFAPKKDPIVTFLSIGGENAIHVVTDNAGSSADRTRANLAGRQALLRIVRFLRAQPGFEHLQVDWWASETGVRETWTIDGVTRVTVQDYTSGRVWPDALCHSFYPIDLHNPAGGSIDTRPLEFGTVPSMPRGALVPKGGSRIVVGGRCVSGDQWANSAFRIQASCMATGQSAGALAGLAAKLDTDILDVPLDAARDALRASGAIIPGDLPVFVPAST